MHQSSSPAVSALLAQWQAGDEDALRALLPIVYDKLRRVAHRYLQKERPGHTLQSTELVHEAYLRLIKQGGREFENRAHFFGHLCPADAPDSGGARAQPARSQAGFRPLANVGGCVNAAKIRSVDLIALDNALTDLAKLDQNQSRIVELRYFGGLSIEETSEVLGVSPATIKREWATARAWLHHEMSRTEEHDA